MAKNKAIIILGIVVALLPFLGFPGSWETFFFVVIGILIALLALLVIAKDRVEATLTPEEDTI